MRRALGLRNGRLLDLDNPDPQCFDLQVIGQGLGREQRWGNQANREYSVAQHSCNVEALIHKLYPDDLELRIQAIFHDASEFVFKDFGSPAKKMVPEYYPIEARIMEGIGKRFGFTWPLDERVKRADMVMLCTEWDSLMPAELWAYMTSEHQFPEGAKNLILPDDTWDANVYDSVTAANMWIARAADLLRARYR